MLFHLSTISNLVKCPSAISCFAFAWWLKYAIVSLLCWNIMRRFEYAPGYALHIWNFANKNSGNSFPICDKFYQKIVNVFPKNFQCPISNTPLYTLVIFENPNLFFVKICVRFWADFTKCSENVRTLGVVWVYPENSFV